MTGTANGTTPPVKAECRVEPSGGSTLPPIGTEELRLRVQRLSLREQLERNHFLLERLNASSARLIQTQASPRLHGRFEGSCFLHCL